MLTLQTETRGMMPKTKEALTEMAAMFMRNPNAIILCVQDGSIDAERSNVTNIVQVHITSYCSSIDQLTCDNKKPNPFIIDSKIRDEQH